jgi:hypothetical protein
VLLLLITLTAAAYLVRPSRVLFAVFIYAFSHFFRVAGLALGGAGIYLRVVASSFPQQLMERLAVAAISAGAAMIVIGTIGINGMVLLAGFLPLHFDKYIPLLARWFQVDPPVPPPFFLSSRSGLFQEPRCFSVLCCRRLDRFMPARMGICFLCRGFHCQLCRIPAR